MARKMNPALPARRGGDTSDDYDWALVSFEATCGAFWAAFAAQARVSHSHQDPV